MMIPTSEATYLILSTLLLTMTSLTATPDRARRDSYFPAAPKPARSYVFTDGVPGCTNGPAGSFTYDWTSSGTRDEFASTCAKGWATGTNRTISLAGNYDSNGYSKLAVYGWTRNPVVEYIVMESFGSSINPASGGVRKGSATCNGYNYDLMLATRVNQPSIDGPVQTFQQIWSARFPAARGKLPRTVDMDCHIKAWEEMGVKLGTHDYQIVAIDAFFSMGSSSFTIS